MSFVPVVRIGEKLNEPVHFAQHNTTIQKKFFFNDKIFIIKKKLVCKKKANTKLRTERWQQVERVILSILISKVKTCAIRKCNALMYVCFDFTVNERDENMCFFFLLKKRKKIRKKK